MKGSACSMPLEELIERLKTDANTGLSEQRVEKRRGRVGENAFRKHADRSVLHTVFEQFKSPLVLVLLAAGIATLVLGEYVDTIVIFAALIINVAIGAYQEARASKAFEKLQDSQEKHATVIRDGRRHVVSARELVPGDLVYIEAGAYVPADMRIVTAKNLTTNEAALTGEWVDVEKAPGECSEDAEITEQTNMAWMGTLITNGFAHGIVTATGSDTQVGEIAESLEGIEDEDTPLQASIRRIAQFLVYAVATAIVLIFALGVFRGEPVGEMLLIAIAIAVAAIPQGLPAAVTVVLALGMEAILRRGGLVRNLLAAETLGATTMILTDKTGTLTQASMSLTDVITCGSVLDMPDETDTRPERNCALLTGVAASDAFFEDADGEQIARGRPIEKAIITRGKEAGILESDIIEKQERLDFMPFDSDTRVAASLHRRSGKRNRVYVSGVPEDLIAWATHVHCGGSAREMTEKQRATLRDAQKRASDDGYRLIGVAYADTSRKTLSDGSSGEVVSDLIADGFVLTGLLIFEDPVRPDVADAIAKVQGAGARVVMITGDNPETAHTVAIATGIAEPGGPVLTGVDIREMSDEELTQRLTDTRVFARVLPAQKLRIARLLKQQGEIVAMTGDGVNDAPALRSANIGVAVGAGTEVAKEASDLVLIDNSFSIIVAAIEEGRKIIDNLKKIVAYLLSTSFSEIVLIGGALIAGAPLPILPTQIIWANIVEEGLMSFSFAFERPEPGIMERDPRSARAKRVLTSELRTMIGILVVSTGAFLLALFGVLMYLEFPIEKIRTIMFVAVSIDSIFFTFSLKALRQPLWRISILTNWYLLGAVAASVLLLVAAVTVPFLQTLLSTQLLSGTEWLIIVVVGAFNLAVIEGTKYFIFERKE